VLRAGSGPCALGFRASGTAKTSAATARPSFKSSALYTTPHAALAEFLGDAVMRDGLAGQGAPDFPSVAVQLITTSTSDELSAGQLKRNR